MSGRAGMRGGDRAHPARVPPLFLIAPTHPSLNATRSVLFLFDGASASGLWWGRMRRWPKSSVFAVLSKASERLRVSPRCFGVSYLAPPSRAVEPSHQEAAPPLSIEEGADSAVSARVLKRQTKVSHRSCPIWKYPVAASVQQGRRLN